MRYDTLRRGVVMRMRVAGFAAVSAAVVALAAGADQVQMQNGDRYVGQVISMDITNLVLQSDMLGTVRLPRSRVAQITLGSGTTAKPTVSAVTNGMRMPAVTASNALPQQSSMLRQLSASTNLIQRVQAQFLSDADPEAKAKFNELLNGLLTGKLTVSDIRAQAQSTADQIREVRKELGDEGGFAIDGYLAILDHFLKDTASLAPATNRTTAPAKVKAETD